MAQGQLLFSGTVMVRRLKCASVEPLSPSMALRHGAPVWTLAKLPTHNFWAQYPGVDPQHSTWALHPCLGPRHSTPLIPHHCPPEQSPVRWVLLLPLSLAPSRVGMQPSGPGKQHGPDPRPYPCPHSPSTNPHLPAGPCCDCKTSREGRKPRLCCSHSARMHLAKRHWWHRAQGGVWAQPGAPSPCTLSSNTLCSLCHILAAPAQRGLHKGTQGPRARQGLGGH